MGLKDILTKVFSRKGSSVGVNTTVGTDVDSQKSEKNSRNKLKTGDVFGIQIIGDGNKQTNVAGDYYNIMPVKQTNQTTTHDKNIFQKITADIPTDLNGFLEIMWTNKRYSYQDTRFIAHMEETVANPNNHFIDTDLQKLVEEFASACGELYTFMVYEFSEHPQDSDLFTIKRAEQYDKELYKAYLERVEKFGKIIQKVEDTYKAFRTKAAEVLGV